MKNIFAHLGRGKKSTTVRSTSSKAETTPAPKEEDEAEGEEEPKPKPADEEAESEGDEEEAEGEGDEEEDEPDPEKEKEASFRKGIKEGRKRERERCAAIFSNEHAAGREALAATLAFTTDLSAEQVVNSLQSTPSGKNGGLSAAMSKQKNPSLGGGTAAEQRGAGKSLVDAVNRRHTKK